MQNKYQLGQIIKHVNDPDSDAGVITHISITNDRVLYTICLKDWDREIRQVIDAVKHIEESEAVEVGKVGGAPSEPVKPTRTMSIIDELKG